MSKKSNNKPKRGQNFFNLQFQQLGEGWTGRITTLDVRKSAIRLFKDIANGNIDLNKDIQYFNEPSFTHNLKLAADDNAYYNYSVFMALDAYPIKDAMMIQICEEHKKRYYAYSLASQFLNNILIGITVNGGIQTGQFVSDMMAALRDYRYIFNGNYITIAHPGDGGLRVERKEKNNGQANRYRNSGPAKGFPNPSGM